MPTWQKYANAAAWIISVVAIGAVIAYWSTLVWAVRNRQTLKQAADTADGLKQFGVLP